MKSMPAARATKRKQLDPITLEVIRHGIISICDQIDANMTFNSSTVQKFNVRKCRRL